MIDLHCHSNISDGTDSPERLLTLAADAGLRALAITDHDSLEGFEQAQAASRHSSLQLLCGVEIGARFAGYNRSMHILGYFDQDPTPSFRSWLGSLRKSRHQRNLQLMDRLHSLGVRVTWDELHQLAPHQVGRPHFARILVQKGYASSLQDAFSHYLAETGSAWTERDEPSAHEAIRRITEAGGIASFAHPVRISQDPLVLRGVIEELIAAGLGAVECYHTEHSEQETKQLLTITSEFALCATGGSDYHGNNKPGIELGRVNATEIPDHILDNLRAHFCDLRLGCA